MTIIIAVLILLVSSCISGEIDYIKKSFFSSCDRNSDKQIDKEELDSCILDIPTPQTVLNMIDRRAEFIMGLFDKNKDGSLSLSEYLDDSVATARDRNVRVTTRAGEVKELSQDDFMEMMKERDPFGTLIGKNGPRREGNQMIQEEEGSSMYEDLMTAKTDLGNLVRIGNWTHQQLRKIGHANGTMVNLKNLPDGGTSALSDKHEIATFSGRNFTIWLLLTIKTKKTRKQHYEVKVEFDKDKYLPPHLTINEAWLLGEVTTEGSGKLFDRKYQLKLPEMKNRRWTTLDWTQNILFGYFVFGGLLLFASFCINKK